MICNGRARSEADLEKAGGVALSARFQGRCWECDDPWYPGDQIVWYPDMNHATHHASCDPT